MPKFMTDAVTGFCAGMGFLAACKIFYGVIDVVTGLVRMNED